MNYPFSGYFCPIPIRLFLLLLLCALPARAQQFLLYDIDAARFPNLTGKLLALEADGSRVAGLTAAALKLSENGTQRPITLLDCPIAAKPHPISSVLTIDISGSMANRNLDIARAAANTWIAAIHLAPSECAVTSFDDAAYINRDFTTDKPSLLAAVAALRAQGGTDYTAGFIDPLAGAITVAARGKHKRVVVFLTDGMGGGVEEDIVREALATNTVVYCIMVGMNAPPILRNVATRTGGMVFERVQTAGEAEQIYRMILATEQNQSPCTIEWESGTDCSVDRNVLLEMPSRGLEARSSYIAPTSSVPLLEISPSGIPFGGIAPGASKSATVTLTARNHPITISGIVPEDSRFTITSGGAPPAFTLNPGETRTVQVTFTPVDSGLAFSRIIVESDACTMKGLHASGGFPGRRPLRPTLRLVKPNGGETFPVGIDTALEWTGVLPEDTVRLEYSTDRGTTWITIEDSATGLQHPWKIPNTPSTLCLARVTQLGDVPPTEPVIILPNDFGAIRAVMFTPDGKEIISATSRPARIVRWDWRNAKPIDTIYISLSDVLGMMSHPGGDLIVAAVDNTGGASIIDRINGRTDIRLSKSPTTAVAYNALGTLIATGHRDSTARVWDISYAMVSEFRHPDQVRGVAISPDDLRLATACADGIVRLWDLPGGMFMTELRGHTDAVNSVRFSPDGSLVVSAGDDRTARVWNSISGQLLLTLTGHVDQVFSASFSPDGLSILTTSADGTARVWDANSGALKRTLEGHTSLVYSGEWSPDGRRVVTGSGDRTARIWDLGGMGLQDDMSDSLWAIILAKAAARDVDLGEALVGSKKDMVITKLLCNEGNVPVEIREIDMEGGDAGDFSLVSGIPPFVIPPDSCVEVEFRFAPGGAGARGSTLRIITSSDTLRPSIRGLGIAPSLEIVTRVIDFGQVRLGSYRDSIVAVVVRNVGAAPMRIDASDLRGPDSIHFDILAGGGAFPLAPGESREMQLRFTPEWPGRTSGRIEFGYVGAGSPGTAYLFGEGTCSAEPAGSTVAFDGTRFDAPPDTFLTLPLLIRDARNLPPEGGKFIATLRYNRTLLLPVDTGIVIGQGADNDRTVTIHGTWDGKSDTLAVLNFLTALGDSDATPLRIDAFVWESACPVEVIPIDAEVHIAVCNDGGRARLFIDTGFIVLKPARPNPVGSRTTIEFSVAEQGRTQLYVTDISGRTVATLIDGETSPGDHTVELDASSLASGTYFTVLRTPTRMITRALRIAQ